MTRAIVFRDPARQELQQAYDWYEEQRAGLGEDFLLCADAALAAASRHPGRYPIVDGDVRRVLTRRFPYAIFFVTEPERIVVLAVFHASRDPRVRRR